MANGSAYKNLLLAGERKCIWLHLQQECIPVGCVPAARRPYAGVCFPAGGWCVWSRGSVSGPGGCLVWGVVCQVRGGGGVPGRGVCLVGGVVVCQVRRVCLSALWDTTTPPVNRMINRCKNITLATTSLRSVIMKMSCIFQLSLMHI